MLHAQVISDTKNPVIDFSMNEKDEIVMFDGQFIGLRDSLDFHLIDDDFQLLKSISISGNSKRLIYNLNSSTFANNVLYFSCLVKNDLFVDSLSHVFLTFDFEKNFLLDYSFNEFEGTGLEIESLQDQSIIIKSLTDHSILLYLLEGNKFLKNLKIIYDKNYSLIVKDIQFLDKNNVAILLYGACDGEMCSAILNINIESNSWKATVINNCNLSELDSSFNSFLTCTGYTTNFSDDTNNNQDGLIVELNQDLEIDKSILIYADNFTKNEITLVSIANQEYLLAYATFSRFPVIFTQMNSNFEVLSQQGMDFLNPDIIFGNDNNLYIFSKEENFQRILTKTNLDLSLNDCPNYNACLETKEVTFSTQNINLSFSDIDSLKRFDLDWKFTSTGFSPYECQDNPLPSAIFSIPDTICLGECITTEDTDNQKAQYREWSLQTPSDNISIEDSLNFDFCYNSIGTHNLKQVIWVLGCAYEFEKDIEVIDRVNIELKDQVLCEDQTFIDLTNNENPNLMAIWADGVTGLQREISESGYYEATISNGYCDTIVGLNISYGIQNINYDNIIILPPDTVLCATDFPYIFNVPGFENDGFFINGTILDSNIITISQAGQFTFSTIIEGCTYEKIIHFELDPCLSQIYLPTAFSPNADGINDTFMPAGQNFTPIKLEIFNRWGAQINVGTSSWDGTNRGKVLNPDIFFYNFIYQNDLTNEQEQITGCVTLMK